MFPLLQQGHPPKHEHLVLDCCPGATSPQDFLVFCLVANTKNCIPFFQTYKNMQYLLCLRSIKHISSSIPPRQELLFWKAQGDFGHGKTRRRRTLTYLRAASPTKLKHTPKLKASCRSSERVSRHRARGHAILCLRICGVVYVCMYIYIYIHIIINIYIYIYICGWGFHDLENVT